MEFYLLLLLAVTLGLALLSYLGDRVQRWADRRSEVRRLARVCRDVERERVA